MECGILDFNQDRIACFSLDVSLGLGGEITFVFIN